MSEQKKPTTGRSVTVLGAGSWGTALANHLQSSGQDVTLWGRDEDVLSHITEQGMNPRYLKGFPLAKGLCTESDLTKAVSAAELLVVAVPSSGVRQVLSALSGHIPKDLLVVSGVKGLETSTLKRPSQIIAEELGNPGSIGALGGPNFAAELVQGFPTAATLAAHDIETAKSISDFFHHGNLRIYTSTDVIGVEFGGALKNVIALATGIVDGVGMGQNARAALVTRGLAELTSLAVGMGADPRTVGGLSGLGDLLLTAVGDLSRNRQVGLRLGRGEKLEDITKDLGQVAEGVKSAHLALELAKKLGIEMPIVEQTDALLSGKTTVEEAVEALLAREQKRELA